MKPKCEDCFVGFGDGEILHGDIMESEALRVAEFTKKDHEEERLSGRRRHLVKMDGVTLLSNLKSDYDVFEFCPRCGHEIKWKAILHEQ